ncbi:hypothetical protein RIF29_29609 [Crotalaria pallida]|uniref:Uncharacterized protein n=1 Tax=Crotalaria pallida TaxID=3830 RepID=A0AAN9EEV1_CROPI
MQEDEGEGLEAQGWEEENRFYWDQTHVGQLVNALNQFSFLNQHLNVHGAHPDYRVENNQIVSEDGPVDLSSADLPNPRELVDDTSVFPENSIVLSDSEDEP